MLLDADELKRFTDLRLRLWVNGELRQDMTVADMIYLPVQALQALTRFQRLDPGDLLLTGTPVGTALSAPPKPVEIIASLLPPATKWKLFFKRPGAATRSTSRTATSSRPPSATDDGAIDLGRQRTIGEGRPMNRHDLLWPRYAAPSRPRRDREPSRSRARGLPASTYELLARAATAAGRTGRRSASFRTPRAGRSRCS